MNNEETIVMKPQNNNKAEQTQSVETVDKKSNKGKKVVATAATPAPHWHCRHWCRQP